MSPHDDQSQRIEVLELSRSRWKAVALVSTTMLVLVLVIAAVLGVSRHMNLQAAMLDAEAYRQRAEEGERQASEQMERAQEAEMEARRVAEHERKQAEAARKK